MKSQFEKFQNKQIAPVEAKSVIGGCFTECMNDCEDYYAYECIFSGNFIECYSDGILGCGGACAARCI